jgi:hypothetical protein
MAVFAETEFGCRTSGSDSNLKKETNFLILEYLSELCAHKRKKILDLK